MRNTGNGSQRTRNVTKPEGYIEEWKRESTGATLTIGELISVICALRETRRPEDEALADSLKARTDEAIARIDTARGTDA